MEKSLTKILLPSQGVNEDMLQTVTTIKSRKELDWSQTEQKLASENND